MIPKKKQLRFKSIFLIIIFTSFLVTPAIFTLFGHQADVSIFFSMNEEENAVKFPKLASEFHVNDTKSCLTAIQFLKTQKNPFQYYLNNYKIVFLEVISPPPKFT